MGWMEFTASVVGSLAWPAVVVVFVVLARRQLAGAVGRLARLKVDGSKVEAEFHQVLDSAASKADQLPRGEPRAQHPEDGPAEEGVGSWSSMEFPYQEFQDEMEKLAEISPAAAMAESYSRLEHFIRSNLGRHELVEGNERVLRKVAEQANSMQLLSDTSIELLSDLTRLRNAVTHDRDSIELSRDEAVRFAGIARAVAFDLAMRLSRTKHDVTMTM